MNNVIQQANYEIAEPVFDQLDVRQSTRREYKYRIKHFLEFTQNKKLTKNVLLDYKQWLRDNSEMSIATKNKYLTCARTFLREGFRMDILPIEFNTSVKSFQQNKKHKVYGLDDFDVARVCQWMNDHPDKVREHALLCLLLFQGLRQFEICDLNMFEVDLEARTILVRSKGMDDKEIINLHPQTAKALERYLELRKTTWKASNSYLFISHRKHAWDEKLTVRGLRFIIKGIFDEAGIKRSVHGFRHFYTTHLIKNMPGSLLQVAQFTRHKSVETLQIYNDSIIEKESVSHFKKAFNDVAEKIVYQP